MRRSAASPDQSFIHLAAFSKGDCRKCVITPGIAFALEQEGVALVTISIIGCATGASRVGSPGTGTPVVECGQAFQVPTVGEPASSAYGPAMGDMPSDKSVELMQMCSCDGDCLHACQRPPPEPSWASQAMATFPTSYAQFPGGNANVETSMIPRRGKGLFASSTRALLTISMTRGEVAARK